MWRHLFRSCPSAVALGSMTRTPNAIAGTSALCLSSIGTTVLVTGVLYCRYVEAPKLSGRPHNPDASLGVAFIFGAALAGMLLFNTVSLACAGWALLSKCQEPRGVLFAKVAIIMALSPAIVLGIVGLLEMIGVIS